MRTAQQVPNIVSGNGLPSFCWVLFLLLFCSSTFAQPARLDAGATPAAAWLLAGSLTLMCLALSFRSLRREREFAHA